MELDTGKGLAVLEACRKLGITEQTDSRWTKEYGGLRVDHAKRLKPLEQENLRLKRLVANQALDLSILNEVAEGNFYARLVGVRPWSMWWKRSMCLSAAHVGPWDNCGLLSVMHRGRVPSGNSSENE